MNSLNILSCVFYPIYLMGWFIGFIFRPFWTGLCDGYYYLLKKRVEKVKTKYMKELDDLVRIQEIAPAKKE